jgi:hypothetical protein
MKKDKEKKEKEEEERKLKRERIEARIVEAKKKRVVDKKEKWEVGLDPVNFANIGHKEIFQRNKIRSIAYREALR